eukprot:3236940-Pyramimonas_sp.AAC.1
MWRSEAASTSTLYRAPIELEYEGHGSPVTRVLHVCFRVLPGCYRRLEEVTPLPTGSEQLESEGRGDLRAAASRACRTVLGLDTVKWSDR